MSDLSFRTESAARPGSAMYTPRTPRMRQRQRFDLSTRSEDDEMDWLKVLVGQTWNVYAVSVLFGIKQDDVHFKLYSKKLREEIASTLTREDVTYDATFSVIENITSRPNCEDSAIQIKVVSKTSVRGEEVEKVIYKGILLSWRTQTESNIQNSIRLPLLLCRGNRSCMDAVHAVVSRMFDCLIVALPSNEDDLSWLIPIIILATSSKEAPIVLGEIQMVYTMPELPVTDAITVKVNTSYLRSILSVIVKDQNDRVNISLDHAHVETFYEVLHKQMLTLGFLKLGLFTLHRIILPGTIIGDTKMKVKNVELLDNILLYFNDKALDTFHTVHIDA